jgi:hypothetical protein
MQRRVMLHRLALGATAVGAPALLAGCSQAVLQMPAFGSIDAAVRTLDGLKTVPLRSTGAWDLAHVLHHAAQSIEFSMVGFPAPKPAWFRSTIGPLAASVFSARGRMSHDLAEPIPGAPDIAQGQPLPAAADRAIAALKAFDAWGGPLAPHFAYGDLAKPDYARAHLMHFANHWQEVAA